MATYELCCDMIDVATDISSIYGNSNRSDGFDPNSSAVITLKTKQVIFLRQINLYLALVCVIKEENYQKQGLIDHNFDVFKGVSDYFSVFYDYYVIEMLLQCNFSKLNKSSSSADSIRPQPTHKPLHLHQKSCKCLVPSSTTTTKKLFTV